MWSKITDHFLQKKLFSTLKCFCLTLSEKSTIINDNVAAVHKKYLSECCW
jgi:hypothetical protein